MQEGDLMTEAQAYDYQELAFDLYNSADELLSKLVDMRKRRKMTQTQLAEAMNVTQGYISQIENGRTSLTSLLTDYALEVGARIDYTVEPAETKPEGSQRYIYKEVKEYNVPVATEWEKNGPSMGHASYRLTAETKDEADAGAPKRITLIPEKRNQQDISITAPAIFDVHSSSNQDERDPENVSAATHMEVMQ